MADTQKDSVPWEVRLYLLQNITSGAFPRNVKLD